jgi:hypothetical protein
MVTITGTKEELIKFIDEMLCECPPNMGNYDCENYKKCEECVLDNETRFQFVIKKPNQNFFGKYKRFTSLWEDQDYQKNMEDFWNNHGFFK